MITLANKYRPTTFEDVVGQDINTKILQNQIKTKQYSPVSLLVGNAGCGKTTCAKIFANQINGEIIELDCATHNGVAEIKDIVDKSRTRSILHDYKVIILDECQCLTKESWSSLLIVLEENIPTTIFVFCTTDPQKIPNTIFSRSQRLDFTPISNKLIFGRLKQVCEKESIDICDDSLKLIVKSANGGLRQALTNLDKCIMYGDLSLEAVSKVINYVTADVLDDLYNAYVSKDLNDICKIIDHCYASGYDLHGMIKVFLGYAIKQKNIELMSTLLTTLQDIRYDDTPKNIIIARLIT